MTKLTKRIVESTEPGPKSAFVWDDHLPGFGVKVLPSGARRYVVKYRVGGGRSGRQRWYTLGTHGAVTCEQARETARQVLAAVARGDDPQANRLQTREAPTVADLWRRYQQDHLPRKKPRSASEDEHKARAYILPALGRHRVRDVTRADVKTLHRRLSDRPYQANRVLALLSKLFNLAEAWDMRPDNTNPCRHVEKYKEASRERYLTGPELERLGRALREATTEGVVSPHAAAAIELLLLTGARVSEILSAEWSSVDWDRRTLNLPDSKTGAKPVFLSHPALELLHELATRPEADSSPYVIKGRLRGQPMVNLSKPWKRVAQRAGLEDVRLHDLRHTAASIGVAQGLGLPIVGRLLGHAEASTTQRYAHVDVDPALAAADKIGAEIFKAPRRCEWIPAYSHER